MLTRLTLCLLLMAPLAASAQLSLIPIVTDVLDNPAGNQITINGTGFGPGTPTFKLTGTNLTVAMASASSIVVTIPASFPQARTFSP